MYVFTPDPPTHTCNTGIDGIKVKVFGTSMDTPGRADLLGMQGCKGYTHCCVCKHCFSPGIHSARQLIFDGYRRFLNDNSRGRAKRVQYAGHVYEYSKDCTRPKPRLRNNASVRTAVAFSTQRNHPFMGHKSLPLLARWPGFDWYRMNVPDLMHGTQYYMCDYLHAHSIFAPTQIVPTQMSNWRLKCWSKYWWERG